MAAQPKVAEKIHAAEDSKSIGILAPATSLEDESILQELVRKVGALAYGQGLILAKLKDVETASRRSSQPSTRCTTKSATDDVEPKLEGAIGKGVWLQGRVKLWRSESNYGFVVIKGYDIFVSGPRVEGGKASIVGATVYAQVELDVEKGPGKKMFAGKSFIQNTWLSSRQRS